MDGSREPGFSQLIVMVIMFVLIAGFFIGVLVDRHYMTYVHWKELVDRGYAEEIETSAGVGYRWREGK
jgi:hypothetical protein